MKPLPLIPTTVVGSYPQPDWLIDRDTLKSGAVPRVRRKDVWRIPTEHLEEAQNDATLLAIRDMERAGVDIISDGEMRRESYSNHFATALDGVDKDTPAMLQPARAGRPAPAPPRRGPTPFRAARPPPPPHWRRSSPPATGW